MAHIIHHPSTTRKMQKKIGENGYKWVKIGQNGWQFKYVISRMHKKLENPYHGTTNPHKRAETRVQVGADIHNFALCARHSHSEQSNKGWILLTTAAQGKGVANTRCSQQICG